MSKSLACHNQPIPVQLFFPSGYLSSVGTEGIAFLRSENQPKEAKSPYIQLQLHPSLLGNSRETMVAWHTRTNIRQEVIDKLHAGDNRKNGITVMPTLLHSKSRGTVRLQSSDYSKPPAINPEYLSHPDDVKILVEGQHAQSGGGGVGWRWQALY